MIVEAVRDDGALLVTDGEGAAVVLPDGAVHYRSTDSVYARGGWEPAESGLPVPAVVDPVRLAEVRARTERTII